MADRKTRHVFDDLRGGRNGFDPSWALGPTECAEAFNVDWYRTRCGRPRGGTVAISMAFSSGGPFTGKISRMVRYVPGTEEAVAELWAVDDAATPVWGRKIGAASFVPPTLKDAMTGNAWDLDGATANGKLYLAYKSAQARLHVWDGTTVRRAGLAAMAPHTTANTGAGTYAAVLRYYRTRATEQVAGVTVRRSEASSSGSFTPSGGGTAARVTQGAPPGEGETHWEVEASLDNVTFYRIATVVIGTTTYDDSALTTTYNTNPLSALTGTYTLQKPYKFVAGDQNRLLGFGSWTTTDPQNVIELSAVVGSLDVGDTERVDTTTNYRLRLDENDSGPATGLCGPVLGVYLAFKSRQVWTLSASGNLSAPFRVDSLSKTVGAMPRSMVIGEDAAGNPAAYWMSQHGPYRWSAAGLEYIGKNIQDLTVDPDTTDAGGLKLSFTLPIAHTLFLPDKRQVWFWFVTNGASQVTLSASNLVQYDIGTGGYSRYVGGANTYIEEARCSAMWRDPVSASVMALLSPHFGDGHTANKIVRADIGLAKDETTSFPPWAIVTGAIEPGGPGYVGETGDVSLLAASLVAPADPTSVNVSVYVDLVDASYIYANLYASAAGSANLPPIIGTHSLVVAVAKDTGVNDARFVQVKVWSTTITAGTYGTDIQRIVVPFKRHEGTGQ